MKTYNVYAADGYGTDTVEPATIHIGSAAPDGTDYNQQGATLAQALWSHLPGATIDTLLQHLMLRHTSLLRVPLPKPEPDGNGHGYPVDTRPEVGE